jgi:AraC-like DNA-binding protein
MSCFSSLRIAAYRGITAMPPHTHETAILCLPLRGSYIERTRGRETGHQLGDLLLCPPGEAHSQLFPNGAVTKLLMVPTAETLALLADFVPVGEAPFGRFAGLGALAIRLDRELAEPDLQSPLVAEGLALQILGLFARDERRPERAAWLESARDFVHAHALDAVRLADVAAHVGRRPAQVAGAYRRAFGCTIGEDARALRLKRAASLLASTSEPIAGIAVECGYYDQAHFSRQFRRAFGTTPLAWRRRLH